MNQTNFSSKLTSFGIATLSAFTATAMLGVDSVQAAIVYRDTLENTVDNCTSLASNCGGGFMAPDDASDSDKRIYDFVRNGVLDDSRFDNTIVELIQNDFDPLDYDFVLDFAGADGGVFDGDGALEYTIQIVPESNNIFVGVGIDSDVFGTTPPETGVTSVIKDERDNLFASIVSPNGNTDNALIPGNVTILNVTDTLSTTAPGEITEISNEFVQRPHDIRVPEPASILGLLAVGSLGLGLKPKKKAIVED